MKPASEIPPKPVPWIGSSKEDLSDFPEDVRLRVGGALWEAQIGRKAPYAKPLKGFGDAGVLEVVDDFAGIRSVRSTQSALQKRFMCSMPFRRNRSGALPRLRPNWT